MDNASFAHFSCKNFHLQLIHNVQQCDDFLDVALWVEGKTIYAHRVILAAGSPVFHQMFKHHETTEKIPIIMLFDIKYEHLMAIVQYIYSGSTQVAANELDEFFRVADKLKILNLRNTTSEEHADSLCSSSVVFNVDSSDDENDDVVAPKLTPKRKVNGNKSDSVERLMNSTNASDRIQHAQKRARSMNSSEETLAVSQVLRQEGQNNDTSAKGSGEVTPGNKSTNTNGNEANGEQSKEIDGGAKSTDSAAHGHSNTLESSNCSREKSSETPEQRHDQSSGSGKRTLSCKKCKRTFLFRIERNNHKCRRKSGKEGEGVGK